MKLDHEYQKYILDIIECHDSFRITMNDLMKEMEVKRTEKDIDKFIGHLLLLSDTGCIESNSENLGVVEVVDGFILNESEIYRMTALGYEYLTILRKDKILNKIKNYSIDMALDIGRKMLLNQTLEMLGS